MRSRLLPLTVATVLATSACTGVSAPPVMTLATGGAALVAPTGTSSPANAATEVIDVAESAPDRQAITAADAVLVANGMTGRTLAEVVSDLDRQRGDRAPGLKTSITDTVLTVEDMHTHQRVRIPLPADSFYLSVAPYTTTTHPCTWHSFTGCRGEHPNAPMTLTVTRFDGTTLYRGPATTFANGFVGMWLPRNITGTLRFEHAGRTATGRFSTLPGSPTCLTTLHLT